MELKVGLVVITNERTGLEDGLWWSELSYTKAILPSSIPADEWVRFHSITLMEFSCLISRALTTTTTTTTARRACFSIRLENKSKRAKQTPTRIVEMRIAIISSFSPNVSCIDSSDYWNREKGGRGKKISKWFMFSWEAFGQWASPACV